MILESVVLAFDPAVSDGMIKEVFSDELARTLWLAIKQAHIVDQNFSESCLIYARRIEKLRSKGMLNAEQLFRILAGTAIVPGCGVIGSGEGVFAAELLPFIMGEKSIAFKVKV